MGDRLRAAVLFTVIIAPRFVHPLRDASFASISSTEPPTGERVRRLRAMHADPTYRPKDRGPTFRTSSRPLSGS